MRKINISNVIKSIRNTTIEHSPEILIGVGIAGMVSTTIMAVKATPKALDLIERRKKQLNNEAMLIAKNQGDEVFSQVTKLEILELIKTTWKCYVPAMITCSISIACIIGANTVNSKRNAALATAYTLSESTLKEYQKKVVETIGEKKEQVVRDAVAKERVEKNPPKNNEVIITRNGDTLCLDSVSGRYFKSDIDKLKKSENILNRRLIDEMYISLNEFYYEIGLPAVKIGDDIGWNVDNGLISLNFSSQLSEDDTPCLVIDYSIAPRYEYRSLL